MRSRLLAITFAAALIGVACGSDDSGDSADTAAPTATGSSTDTDAAAPGGAYSQAPVAADDADGADTSAAPASEAPADAGGSDAGPPVTVATGDLGEVLVDQGGFVLYGFTPDEGGTPTCEGGCADAWPPVVVDSAELPPGLDAAVFTVVERSDGAHQLAAGGWPLYRYAGDISPGDTTGQGSGGVWFAAAPDGTLIGS